MEIYQIPAGDQWIIYRPLAGLAFVGNRAMAQLAARAGETGAATVQNQVGEAGVFLKRIGFYEPDPPAPEPWNPDATGMDFQPTLAVLLLTNRCQLRCVYCYAAAGEAPQKDLTIEVGKQAIDYVYQTAVQLSRGYFHVSFHGGGEPAISWRVLRACTEYTRQKPFTSKVSITSNGIWSPGQLDWITSSLDEASISMDGRRQTQDRQRPFASGRESSSWIMRTLSELDRRSFSYGIRMTATAPWESLAEDVRFLCEETGCRSIQVEPAFNHGRGGHGQAEADEVHLFLQAFLEGYETAARAGRSLYCSSARLGLVSATFCTAPYSALIVNADGDLVTCYEVSGAAHPLSGISRIGRIEDGEVKLDFQKRAEFHALMAERRSTCRGCFCYWSCAGDCYPRAFDSRPGGHLLHSQRCELNRELTSQMLLRAIAENGGVWRSPWRAAPSSAFYAKDEGLG
jgi:uncharacterized protein